MTDTTVSGVMADLAALEDTKTREVNEKHGDDHGVNLTEPRAHDRLVNYVVKKNPHSEELRLAWSATRIRWSPLPAGRRPPNA